MIEARYAAIRNAPGCGRRCPCRAPKAAARVFGWIVNVFSTGVSRRVVEVRLSPQQRVFAQVEVASV